MATTSTAGAVCTALLQKYASLTWPTLLGSNEPPVLFDGFPGPSQPDNFIVLNGQPIPTASGNQQYAGLGGAYKYEDYEIANFVSCFVAGAATDGTVLAPSDAQSAARTNAYDLFAVIETALRQDKQLLLVANPPGILWCEITQHADEESNENSDEDSLAMGRYTTIEFRVRVHGRIGPI
jgi:hypothetical protein